MGSQGTLEGIYNKDINTAFVNRGLNAEAPMNISDYADNRFIYPNTVTATNNLKYYQVASGGAITTYSTGSGSGVSPIVLEHRKGGYYYSLTAKLERAFDHGFQYGGVYP